MLAQAIGKRRTLWLYDSFEGLPAPHASKDVLIDDRYNKGSMAAYEGMLSFPEQIVLGELANVRPGTDWFRITKGWITAESLKATSPDRIAFAYLDMDFYQSTLDVLLMLNGGKLDFGIFDDRRHLVGRCIAVNGNRYRAENLRRRDGPVHQRPVTANNREAVALLCSKRFKRMGQR